MERPVPKRFCELGMAGPCSPTASAERLLGSERRPAGLMELMMLLPPKATPSPSEPKETGAPPWYEMP